MDYLGSKGSVAEIARNVFSSREREKARTSFTHKKRTSFVAPIWTTIMGWDFDLMNKVIEHRLFISDQLEFAPEYCLASRAKGYTVVQSSAFTSKQFNKAHDEEGYIWQLVDSDTTALVNAQKMSQYAALCTKEQARAYGLYEVQEVFVEGVEQVCGLIIEGQTQKLLTDSILFLEFSEGRISEGISFLSAFMKQNGVEILDLTAFPGRKNGYLFKIDSDYKQARVRKAFNHFLDLDLGRVMFLGGKQKEV